MSGLAGGCEGIVPVVVLEPCKGSSHRAMLDAVITWWTPLALGLMC